MPNQLQKWRSKTDQIYQRQQRSMRQRQATCWCEIAFERLSFSEKNVPLVDCGVVFGVSRLEGLSRELEVR